MSRAGGGKTQVTEHRSKQISICGQCFERTDISPEYSLEGLMLKPKLQYHLMQRADLLEKTLMLERLKAGGEGDDRG